MGAAELPGCARLELAQGVVPLNPQEAVFEGMLAGWARQQRSRFLQTVTGGPWTDLTHYHLCVNTGAIGLDETVKMVVGLTAARRG